MQYITGSLPFLTIEVFRYLINLALNTKQIDAILRGNIYTKNFYYTTMPTCRAVNLPKRQQFGFITNVDHHSRGGSHWTGWFSRSGHVYFFDSFGRSPTDPSFPHVYRDILLNFKSFSYFDKQIQSTGSYTCGYFCIHFILHFCLGLDMKSLKSDYSDNTQENDIIVLEIIKSII